MNRRIDELLRGARVLGDGRVIKRQATSMRSYESYLGDGKHGDWYDATGRLTATSAKRIHLYVDASDCGIVLSHETAGNI